MRHSFIYIASLFLVVLGSCVKHDLEPDLAVRSGKVVRTFLETPATKADLALGSADGYTNPSPVVEALPMEKDSTVRFQDVKFPYRDEVYEREYATKVTIANNGSMAFSYGDKIAYCISNGSSTSYNVSTIDLTEGGFSESLPSGYSRCNYAIYPASARGTNYTAPTVVYADTYDLDDATDEETFSWAPMVGRNNGESVSFYHVGGVLRVNCDLIPVGTAKIRVTFNGMSYVTGTYSVSNPGTSSASTTLSSGNRNYVEFTKDSFGFNATLNIPLPSGDYSSCTAVTFTSYNSGGTELSSQVVSWWLKEVGRGCGYKMSVQVGSFEITNNPMAIWKGETFSYTASSPATVTWSSSNTAVATVNQSGLITALGIGESEITITIPGTSYSASCMVYVNELTGIRFLSSSYKVVKGGSRGVAFEGIINNNGTKYGPVNITYSTRPMSIIPKTVISSANTGIVTVSPENYSEGNYVNGINFGSTTLTINLPANSYGTHAAFSASASITVDDYVVIGLNLVSRSPSSLVLEPGYGAEESDFMTYSSGTINFSF